jgi:hypothetical protein
MPLFSTAAVTAFVFTLSIALCKRVRKPDCDQIIADIEQYAKQLCPTLNHRLVIVEPSDGDGIWSAGLQWAAGDGDVVLQAFAVTEREALVRLRRIVRKARRVAGWNG